MSFLKIQKSGYLSSCWPFFSCKNRTGHNGLWTLFQSEMERNRFSESSVRSQCDWVTGNLNIIQFDRKAKNPLKKGWWQFPLDNKIPLDDTVRRQTRDADGFTYSGNCIHALFWQAANRNQNKSKTIPGNCRLFKMARLELNCVFQSVSDPEERSRRERAAIRLRSNRTAI